MKRHWYIKALAACLALMLCGLAVAEEKEYVLLLDPDLKGGMAVLDEAPKDYVGKDDAPAAQPETTAEQAPAEQAPAQQADEQAAPEAAQPQDEIVLISEDAQAPAAEAESPAAEAEKPATDGENPPADGESPAPEGQTSPADSAPEAAGQAEGADATQGDPSGEAGEESAAVAAPEDDESASAATATADEAPDRRLGVGEKFTLEGREGSFASENPEVATVDAKKGVVTGVSVGTAAITATDKNGKPIRRVVEVLKAPGKLSLAEAKLTLGKGEKRQLVVRLPDGTACSTFSYKSSRKSVASVDASGRVVAKKTGTAQITVTAFNGAKVKCSVKVLKAPSKVTLSATKLVLCEGETGTLKARLSSKSASTMTWTSSDPGIVRVDGPGKLTGVAPGAAEVTAESFNGKRAVCKVTVLEGGAPTSVSAGVEALTLGVRETFALSPTVGAGENTVFSYSSSRTKVAKAASNGVVTAKATGTATITVKTHNGLKATVKVEVVKAPSKVTISKETLSMRVGETAMLSASVPSGAGSAFTWSSSDADVATVDENGCVTAKKAGTAQISVATYNGKTSACALTVTEDGPSVDDDTGDDAEEDDAANRITPKQMLKNLRASSVLGGKKEAIVNVIGLLIDNGFEPAFAAGVGANILAEGTYGLFESSRYASNPKKRPRYFCYLDGGKYYVDGVLTTVYVSKEEIERYKGGAEVRERYGEENFYLNNYSRKNVSEVNLAELEKLLKDLEKGGWEGKFGLGIVQWTGSRTKKLVSFYRKHAGSKDSITSSQVVAAENEMILSELRGGYKGVYSAWKDKNKKDYATPDAAYSAGSIVCLKYEIPANKDRKAVERGEKARDIYKVMTKS